MSDEQITPSFRTPPEDYSSSEKAKISTQGLAVVVRDVSSPSNLHHQLRDLSFGDLADVAESLAKSYGVYLEFNRAKTGVEKDWIYMVRISVPGGGPITGEQWRILDQVSERYTLSDSYTGTAKPSIRVTTRQNFQLHWIKKDDLVDSIREIAKSGFYTINGCGDNVRNVMGCPFSHFSKVFNANAWAQKVGRYFRLPSAAYIEVFEIDPDYLRDERGAGERFDYGPTLLNRKFKIAFSALHFDETTGAYVPENCVELRTNDIGVAPIAEDDRVSRFQVYVGGGQGQRAGHHTFSALGEPLGVFSEENLLTGLDAIVKVHKEWGDRKNRHWARMKYLVYKMGIAWVRDRVREMGVDLESPQPNLDYGPRDLHHGWRRQESNGLWCCGTFLENGRIIDGQNGRLKTMVRELMQSHPSALLFTTPNQDLLFANVREEEREDVESEMRSYGYGMRNGRPYSRLRVLSGACVGRDTCRLTYTDSEKFEPYLLDQMEVKWADLGESIGITGCERQCFRPATKTIGWVGSGLNIYSLRIGGSEDGRWQGGPLVDPETREMYLHSVPRKEVTTVTDALFEFYLEKKGPEDATPGSMGRVLRRAGPKDIINWLKSNSKTAGLMSRTVSSQLASPQVNPSMREQQGG